MDKLLSPQEAEFRFMVGGIKTNKQLKYILRKCKPELRKPVYEKMLPHLEFKPKPFWLLNV